MKMSEERKRQKRIVSSIDPKTSAGGAGAEGNMCRIFHTENSCCFRLNANAWATTFLSLFCRHFFFIFFWLFARCSPSRSVRLFFQKHIANHFFPSYHDGEGDVVKRCICRRCLSLHNKDTEQREEKESSGAVSFLRGNTERREKSLGKDDWGVIWWRWCK